MTRRVEIVLGPPGTGKTTTLLNEVDKVRTAGIPLERVGFVSFSKRAIREVIERLGGAPDDHPHFRTIHSTAYRMLKLQRGEVMQAEHLDQLAEITGTPFARRRHGGGSVDEALWEGTLGDRSLALHDLARARGTTLEAEWRRANMADLPFAAVQRCVTQYERFKTANYLWDFPDMVLRGQGTLDVDVLFIDEAQDNSPAQWAFLRRVSPAVPRVVMAGDDDQAVFAWSGADATALLRFKGERRVLPQSHRMPRAVKRLADRVVGHIRVRVPKTFEARDAEGAVSWVTEPEHLNLSTGTWLLLARSNYQLRELYELARTQGVVYTLPNGEWSWNLPCVRAARVYERLRRGDGRVTRGEVAVLGSYLPAALPAPLPEVVTWDDLFTDSGRDLDWMAALALMPPADREYVRALRRRGESLTAPGRVRIGTVHSVKGAEAEHVALVTDVSRRVDTASHIDPDAELRVQYVGITRAAEHLYLIRPRTPTHWAL